MEEITSIILAKNSLTQGDNGRGSEKWLEFGCSVNAEQSGFFDKLDDR